jgi:hypothetical protein
MQAASSLRLRNRHGLLNIIICVTVVVYAAKAGVAASPASLQTLHGVLFLMFLHLHMRTFWQTAGLKDGAS